MIDVAESGNADRQSQFLQSLIDFSKEHRAAHWSGSFANFLAAVVPADAHGIVRSSHQYIWDMMRAYGGADDKAQPGCRLFADELFGIDESLVRLADYFKAASAGSEIGRAHV